MFPNVRMMIAATLASIVGLSFTFGVMATFFVSHEPRGLMTSHARPLQFGVDTAAPVIAETFGSRFQLNATRTDHAALHDSAETIDTLGPLAMAKPDGDAEDGDIVSPVAPAAEAPAAEAAAASDPDTTEPATVSSIAAGPAGQAAAGAEAEPPPPPSMPEPGQAAKNDEPDEPSEDTKVAAVVAGDPGPVTTTGATEEIGDAQPIEDNAHQPDAAPKAAEKPAARKAKHKAAAKTESRQHVAAKTHRFRRVRPATEATNQAYYQQFAQPNFQTAPLEQQTIRSRVVRSGIGGPFVSPPSH
jgi:hypothetical protein